MGVVIPADYTSFDSDIEDAIRYVNGATDDAAEDAYFALEAMALSDVGEGLRILEAIAAGVDPDALGNFGAGIFESFLGRREPKEFDQVVDTINGNTRLLTALRSVRSLALPSDLALRLAPLL